MRAPERFDVRHLFRDVDFPRDPGVGERRREIVQEHREATPLIDERRDEQDHNRRHHRDEAGQDRRNRQATIPTPSVEPFNRPLQRDGEQRRNERDGDRDRRLPRDVHEDADQQSYETRGQHRLGLQTGR